jgi:lysophospholipase L1-like esterase
VHAVPIHDGIRTARHKLMYFPRNGEWNLFDLMTDPHEMKSVHQETAYAPIMKALQQRYQDMKGFYEVNSAIIPHSRGDETWWRDRDREKNNRLKEGNIDLAFIGDSITQGWEGNGKQVWESYYGARKAVNLGFGGDRTEHVIWRLTKGAWNQIKPKVAVLMIGTNNTGHKMQDPSQTAAGIERILNILKERSPKTKVLLLGVFPRGKAPHDRGRVINQGINQIIRRLADNDRVHYMDLGDHFLQSDGDLPASIMPDALHLNEEGYRIWAEAMEPKLKELGI